MDFFIRQSRGLVAGAMFLAGCGRDASAELKPPSVPDIRTTVNSARSRDGALSFTSSPAGVSGAEQYDPHFVLPLRLIDARTSFDKWQEALAHPDRQGASHTNILKLEERYRSDLAKIGNNIEGLPEHERVGAVMEIFRDALERDKACVSAGWDDTQRIERLEKIMEDLLTLVRTPIPKP